MISGPSRRSLTVAGAVAGLVLFGVTLHAVDVTTALAGLKRVGGGFALILLLAGLRLATRAAAWAACAGGPSRLPVIAAFDACVVGEAAGSLTPLGLAASEPAKVLWIRRHLGAMEAAVSLAAETCVYSVAVAVMLAAGSLAWMLAVAPAAAARALVLGPIAAAGLAALIWAVGRHHGRPLAGVRRWLEDRAPTRPGLGAFGDGIRRTCAVLRVLVSHQPATLFVVALLQIVFQAAAVGEVWLTLGLLGVPDQTFKQAFLLEYANRIVTVGFKFVPLRLGVDELAGGAMASLLGTGSTVGVTVAVVRKARVLCWSAVGVCLAAARAVASRRRPESSGVAADRVDEVPL